MQFPIQAHLCTHGSPAGEKTPHLVSDLAKERCEEKLSVPRCILEGIKKVGGFLPDFWGNSLVMPDQEPRAV